MPTTPQKKILFVSGSPREGNTEYVLTQLKKGLGGELICLRELHLKPCAGCLECHHKAMCAMRHDGANAVMEKVRRSDLLVIGTPNYFDNVPGIMKDFIDRMNPLYSDKTYKGKDVIFVFIGGGNPEGTKARMMESMRGAIKCLKLNVVGVFAAKGLHSRDVVGNTALLGEISEAIKNMLK